MQLVEVIGQCVQNRTLPRASLPVKPDNIVVRIKAHERGKYVL